MFLSLKRNDYFDKIIKKGKKAVNSHFVVYYMPSFYFNDKKFNVGISVGKKIGNAVIRNKNKRIIRYILHKNKINLENCYIVIISRKNLNNEKYEISEKKLLDILKGLS